MSNNKNYRIKHHLYSNDEKAVDSVPEWDGPRPVSTMSVGKDLIKAIAKPTFSHIADAYNGLEVLHPMNRYF
jgi:hypothetical protein